MEADRILALLKGYALVFWSLLVSIVEPFLPKRWFHKDVKNQVVLITGAGSGFGRLLATKFAIDHGSIVVLWDINKTGKLGSVTCNVTYLYKCKYWARKFCSSL